MAFLAVIGSKSTNGVAFIHSEIIKETIFKVCTTTLRLDIEHDLEQSCQSSAVYL